MTLARRARHAIGAVVRRATAPASPARLAESRLRLASASGAPEAQGGPWVFGCGACREAHFHMPLFADWCRQLGEAPRYHRKLWEFVYIAQVLRERGALVAGARGVGFGVGMEPLVALFASLGADVLATDLGSDAAIAAGWVATGQHAVSELGALNARGLCDPATFAQRVRYRTVDMNAIPGDIRGYDFCWSSCACEHLGSIRRGADFVRRSLDVLRPGGIAVHTTELNLSSSTYTVRKGGTVLFRRRDLESLAATLRDDGHYVPPMDFATGSDPIERHVDVPPYAAEPHLRVGLPFRLRWFETTSIGMLAIKGAMA